MNKVVITGASGFIGRSLSLYLADKGINVFAMSTHADRVASHNNIIPISVDLLDEEQLERLLEEINPDVIYHLAWIGMSYEYKNDMAVQRQNIPIYMSVVKAAAGRCGRMVIPGSTSEYAYCGGMVDGTEEPTPGDAYGTVKSELQRSCRQLANEKGLALIWLLIGSVYGPGRTDNSLLTCAIRSLLHGDKTEFTGLEQQWDYLYIDDLLHAMYLVGESGKAGKVYAVGSGDARALAEYIEIVREIINPYAELGIGILPYKNGKCPDNNVPDIRALAEDTGYEAAVPFEIGIRKTIDFIRSIEGE